MKQKQHLNILGLAYRARKCSIGEDVIVKDIQHKRAKLVLLASDTGPHTRKKMMNKCKTYEIPIVILNDSRSELAHAIGKSQRVAVAILDQGFATKIQSLL